jgi:tetratricopeptide (TPR) repeat protein
MDRFSRQRTIVMKLLVFALVASCASVVPASGQSIDGCDTLSRCQAAVEVHPRDSLAHYRLGEIFSGSENWQLAANEFRDALSGDRDPKWTEVWSHINLGKIFDSTGQRDRALNEYRWAQRLGDNTRGAQDEVAKYIESPFKRP